MEGYWESALDLFRFEDMEWNVVDESFEFRMGD